MADNVTAPGSLESCASSRLEVDNFFSSSVRWSLSMGRAVEKLDADRSFVFAYWSGRYIPLSAQTPQAGSSICSIIKRKFQVTQVNHWRLIVSYIKHNVKYILHGVENNTGVASHLARGESDEENERPQRETRPDSPADLRLPGASFR